MDERQRRGQMGCAAMLFAPIFVVGSVGLMNTSRDSETSADIVWSWILLIAAVAVFTGGSVAWLRNREHNRQKPK